ncbi:MAG TPA: F0F1 ATP synthase subunit A [Myxococcales bacterium]|jgi:F-type H+-transporting ATPase subunit a
MSSRNSLLFALLIAALTPSTSAFAQEAAEAPAHHDAPAAGASGQVEATPPHAAEEPSCAAILSDHGAHHAENPEVAEVIFHHVTDSHVVAFESPFSHSALEFDFKKLECQALGWNGVVHVGGKVLDLTPTKHTFWMWVAALVLILMFWFSAPKKGTKDLVPRGFGTLLEIIVLFVRDEIARKNIPGQKDADRYTPYLLNAFFFILVMNFLGLIPYLSSATSNLNVTLGLALLTFLVTQAAGIRAAGVGGYLKHLTGGVHPSLWPIMIPVEFLGLFTKPFALTIRLFANMVAGHIIIFFLLGLIFIMKSAWLAVVSVPFAFAIYLLEIFVALVQAYVFTMLSALFIGMGVAMGHHGGSHEEHGAKGAEHAVHH